LRLLMNQIYVLGDAYRLRQVVSNLASNAIKFSSSKSTVRVALELMRFEPDPLAKQIFGTEALRNAQMVCEQEAAQQQASATGNQTARRMPSDADVVVPPGQTPAPAAAASSTMSAPAASPSGEAVSFSSFPPSAASALTSLFTPGVGGASAAPAGPSPSHLPARLGVAYFRISVKDHGLGLSQAEMNSLFKEYVQISANKTQKGGGTGLGLSIAKSIIQLHGGEIGVRSNADIAAEAAAAAATPTAPPGAPAATHTLQLPTNSDTVMPSPLPQFVTSSPLLSSSPDSVPSPSPNGLVTPGVAPMGSTVGALSTAAALSSSAAAAAAAPTERGCTFWLELPLEVFWRVDEVSSAQMASGFARGDKPSIGGGSVDGLKTAVADGNGSVAGLNAGNSSEAHSTSFAAHQGGLTAADHSGSDVGGVMDRRSSELRRGGSGGGVVGGDGGGGGRGGRDSARAMRHSGPGPQRGALHGAGGGSGGGVMTSGRNRAATHVSSSDESTGASGSDSVHSLGGSGRSGGFPVPIRQASTGSQAISSVNGSRVGSAGGGGALSRTQSGGGSLQPSPEQLRRQLEAEASRPPVSSNTSPPSTLSRQHRRIATGTSLLSHSRQLSINMEEGRRMAQEAMQALADEQQQQPAAASHSPSPQSHQKYLSTAQGAAVSARSSSSSSSSAGSRHRSSSFTSPDHASGAATMGADAGTTDTLSMRASPATQRRLNLSGWAADTGQAVPADDLRGTLERLDRMPPPPRRRPSVHATSGALLAAAATMAASSAMESDATTGLSASPAPSSVSPPSDGSRTTPSQYRRLAQEPTGNAGSTTGQLSRHRTPPALTRGLSAGGGFGASSSSAGASAAFSGGGAGSLIRPGTRVLVVEDSHPNRKLLMSLLVLLKCKPSGVENGKECIDLFADEAPNDVTATSQHDTALAPEETGLLSSSVAASSAPSSPRHSAVPFDVVLIDGTMPVMNGIEATRILRDRGFTRLPIIAVTGKSDGTKHAHTQVHSSSDRLSKSVCLSCSLTSLYMCSLLLLVSVVFFSVPSPKMCKPSCWRAPMRY
jgi:signal transduction histidine kinase/CheY-like chemotaxis protein